MPKEVIQCRPGAKQAQGRSMSRAGAGQEQGRSRAEQSKAEQGRKRAGAGQKLGKSYWSALIGRSSRSKNSHS